MSVEYKKTLQRFEDAVRAYTLIGQHIDWQVKRDIEKEYEEAKRALICKLQYRALAAELRHEEASR